MPDEVFLIDGARTPQGRYGGALASVRPDDLAALVVGEAVRRAGVPGEAVDEVVLGAANQAGEDNRDVARMAVLLAGLPDTLPGYTVNRLCASGLTAVVSAAQAIRSGEAELVVAGGVESMTRAPWVMAKPGTPWAKPGEVHDTSLGWRFTNPRFTAADTGPRAVKVILSMGETRSWRERPHCGARSAVGRRRGSPEQPRRPGRPPRPAAAARRATARWLHDRRQSRQVVGEALALGGGQGQGGGPDRRPHRHFDEARSGAG